LSILLLGSLVKIKTNFQNNYLMLSLPLITNILKKWLLVIRNKMLLKIKKQVVSFLGLNFLDKWTNLLINSILVIVILCVVSKLIVKNHLNYLILMLFYNLLNIWVS
jgi:hypothetical protein